MRRRRGCGAGFEAAERASHRSTAQRRRIAAQAGSSPAGAGAGTTRPPPPRLARYIASSARGDERLARRARGRPDGDPDAGPERAHDVAEDDVLADRGERFLADAGGDLGGGVGREMAQQQGELVAAQPGRDVAGAHAALQARAGLDEDGVAGAVAQGVVDALELVEVEVDDGDRSAGVGGAGELQVDGLVEGAAVESPVSGSVLASSSRRSFVWASSIASCSLITRAICSAASSSSRRPSMRRVALTSVATTITSPSSSPGV